MPIWPLSRLIPCFQIKGVYRDIELSRLRVVWNQIRVIVANTIIRLCRLCLVLMEKK